ncbi:MAG: PHP N-terminal domain protein [Parcubacteria bacterium 33_209]|jgi:ABC-type dipeptide/oligopeptide/nickel transport system ATPase subunit|nr:MAG: PHP N-terminal domain protein [Parcubacteria bacterium 33_209]
MKKIDLHLHTIPIDDKDCNFEFDVTKFQSFVDQLFIDAVAVTNHNLFNLNQFKEIARILKNVVIFPGIEMDFEDGHLLLISENDNLDDFNQKCEFVENEIRNGNKITISKLKEIFVDLSKYLLIPHYDKKPKVCQSVIDSLKDHVFTGEVQSPKKFSRTVKESDSLTPVVFSDARVSTNLDIEKYQGKHTFIKTNSALLTLSVIKTALRDKNKVFLTNSGKHDFFQVFRNGQELSNGLNIVIGGRSSGKTYLLNRLRDIFDTGDTEEKSIKYIEQFDLVKDDEKKFNKRVEKDKSAIREEYLKEFRAVVESVTKIDHRATNYKLEKYIETLLDFASSEKLQDEFSKAALFKETVYQIRDNQETELKGLLQAVMLLLKNNTHKGTINKYLSEDNLQNLFDELTNQYKQLLKTRLKKEWVNQLIRDTRQQLENKTSSPKIEDVDIDFYQIKIERESIKRFNAIANAIKQKKEIKETEEFGKFKIRAIVSQYEGAQGLHDESGKQISFARVFKKYNLPIAFLEELKDIEGLEKSELYRYFCKVTYQVLNKYDKKVSGGEMAEFNLLRALQDARQYDMLLIDEPESSFDNLFLKENVNKEIKDISKEMPVIVVTHNNTIGMLMEPDYLLYTQRKIVNGKDEYRIFSGSFGNKEFNTPDGSESISSYDTLLDSLESGQEAYNLRKNLYNDFKE